MNMSNNETMVSSLFLVVFLVLFIYTAFISKASKLKNDTMEEFASGSRSFNYFVVLCTLIGCFLTAGTYTGWYSWAVYEGLISQYLIIYSITSFFVMYAFSSRIWIWGKNFNLLTQPDFIQVRFRSKALTMIDAVCGIILEAPWCIIEFAALGWAVTAVTGGIITKEMGIILFGVLTVALTTKGGMRSIAAIEVLKGILVMIFVVGGSIVAAYKLFGGFGPMFGELMEVVPENMTINYGGVYPYSYWDSIIITGTLGVFGLISMFARIYTARSVTEVKKAASSGSIAMILISALLLVLATGAILLPGIEDLPDPNMAFYFLMQSAFGPYIVGIVGVLVIITAIGIASIVINAHSVVISDNIIRSLRPDMKEESRRKITRVCIVIYGVIVMLVAMMDLPNLALIAIAMYEGIVQVIPMTLFGIFWRRANKWSVGVGYVAGLTVAITMAAFPDAFPWAGGWTGGVFGLVVNIAINLVLGRALKKEDYVDELFETIEHYKEDSKGNVISQIKQ